MKRDFKVFVLFCLTCLNLISAQLNRGKDTLYLDPNDEFLQLRLSKFSFRFTDLNQYKHIILFEDKPFNGTLIKRVGISCNSYLFDNQFNIDHEDSTFYCINFLNGQFYGDFIYESKGLKFHIYFDKNGNPDKSGYVIFKNGMTMDECYVSPILFPNHLGVKSPDMINLDGFNLMGIYDFHEDKKFAKIFPNISLLEYLDMYAFDNLNMEECNKIDTINFNFQSNSINQFEIKNKCGLNVQFSNFEFIKNVPVFNIATFSGDRFIKTDYNRLPFSNDNQALFPILDYYIKTIISFGDGHFFDKLENIPTNIHIEAKNFLLDIEYDKNKIIRTSKSVPYSEIFYQYKSKSPVNIFELKYYIKNFHLECNKELDNEILKINSNYINENSVYNFTSLIYNVNDTISIGIRGNLLEGDIEHLTINHTGNIDYLDKITNLTLDRIENGNFKYVVKGFLGFDENRNLEIVKVLIEAKKSDFSTLKNLYLIPHGKSTFTYSDNFIKEYIYKNGILIYK